MILLFLNFVRALYPLVLEQAPATVNDPAEISWPCHHGVEMCEDVVKVAQYHFRGRSEVITSGRDRRLD